MLDKKIIHIFGHKNPDTDSICSTLAYAHFKRELGYDNILPCRLGDVSLETQFVLDYFGVEEPEYIDDVEAKLSDLNLYVPNMVNKHDPIRDAWGILRDTPRSRLIPVVDKNNVLEGIISVSDITKLLMEYSDENVTDQYEILFDNFLEMLDTEVKYGNYKYRKIEGKIFIGSPPNDLSEVREEDILITSRTESALEYLEKTECGCLIVTNNRDITPLKNSEKAVVSVKEDIFKIVALINQSISICSIMRKEDIVTFSTENTIEELKNIMKESSHRNFPVLDLDGKLAGIISRRHIIDYPKKVCILVDHNERGQSAEGIERADIVEIIDHHRVADVQTDQPLYIRAEPVGCTATVIYKMYKENNIEIPKKIAGIMLSAILSDTLIFTSPTCTADDRIICEQLAEIAEVDIYEFATAMFEAGSSADADNIDQLIKTDCKAFKFGEINAFISQINTLNLELLMENKDKIFEGLDKFVKNREANLMILMITDVLKNGSQLFIYGKDTELAIRAFEMQIGENTKFLDGVVSRKKQIVPKLMMATRLI